MAAKYTQLTEMILGGTGGRGSTDDPEPGKPQPWWLRCLKISGWVLLALVGLIALVFLVSWAAEVWRKRNGKHGVPPLWPEQFTANFNETSSLYFHYARNFGTYYYDSKKPAFMISHGTGQENNWCKCAGFGTTELCNVLSAKNKFNEDGALFLVFPESRRCCQVGGWKESMGYGVHPQTDWLVKANATYREETVNGRRCKVWSDYTAADPMIGSDDWGVDDDLIPCKYEDKFKLFSRLLLGLSHELIFDPSSYKEKVNARIFVVPEGIDCSDKCANSQGWCDSR